MEVLLLHLQARVAEVQLRLPTERAGASGRVTGGRFRGEGRGEGRQGEGEKGGRELERERE